MPSNFQYTVKSLQCPFKNNWFTLVYFLFKLVLKPVATGRNLKAFISSTSLNRCQKTPTKDTGVKPVADWWRPV